MPDLGNLFQKAFYLGVGLASYASERAGGTIGELRTQAQKLADELVARGEMTTEEARKMVDDMVQQAQQQQSAQPPQPDKTGTEPRRIEIISDDEEQTAGEEQDIDAMRQQVQAMQEELRRLKRE
ncbi:phasin family protein [Coleofasciculus chthonoplastes]|uniref:phasin family protein n=1 Tax=Coleofasciculus chthonoplastes TaxID=64178 RepID=UPI0032F5AF90